MNIQNLTVEQLQSLGYRLIQQLELVQKNLQIVNAEIQKKSEKTPASVEPVTAPQDSNG